MDGTLSNGLVSLLNGFLAMADTLASPITIAFAAIAACLFWLARCECEELTRLSTKPEVERH